MQQGALALGIGALLVGFVASCSSGERGSSSPSPAETAAARPLPHVSASTSRYGWRDLASGGLEARGPNYHARLDRGVLRFRGSAGNVGTPEEPSFELLRIARGAAGQLITSEPVARGSLLTLDRGVAEEQLEARADGLEQSWVFSQRPTGDGDLTLRLRIAGMSLRHVDAKGLHFAAGNRILTYGPATWRDAKHESASVSARYERGDIVLTVPSRLVDSAAYPAVLDPVISSMFVIVPPTRVPGGAGYDAAVACSSSQCLLAWKQEGLLIARRAKLTGELLDDSVITIGSASVEGPFAVSAEPSGGYLVAYPAYAGDANGVLGTLVGADGSVSNLPGFVIDDGVDDSVPQATNPTVEGAVFSGGTHVVMYRKLNIDHYDRYLGRVVNGSVQGGQRGVKVGGASDAAVHSLSAGTTNVLHVVDNRVSRIVAASGSVLDEPAIALSPNAHGAFASSSASTFDGTNHIVIWGNSDKGELYAARLRDSDGQPLDPDVGSSPGARLLCKTGTISQPHAAVAGGRLYVTFRTNQSALVATSFALDPWTSSSADCGADTLTSLAGASDYAVALAGGRGVLIVEKPTELRSLGFDLTTSGTASVSHEGVLNYHGSNSSIPIASVTSNGRDFLISHDQGLERIDGATGERLGPTVVVPHYQGVTSALSMLPTGRDYLTQIEVRDQWESPVSSYYNVRVRCDGAVSQRLPVFGATTVCDGERCLATGFDNVTNYRTVALVDKNGQQLKEPQNLHFGSNAIFYFTATTAPAPDARQFVALTSHNESLVAYSISGATGVVSAPVTLAKTPFTELRAVASDGSYVTALWGNAGDYTGLVFNPVDNSVLVPPKPVPIYLSSASRLTFDGSSYVGFSGQGFAQWLNPALTPVAELQPDIGWGSNLLMAANSYGRTLLVMDVSVPEELGRAVVGYFLDSEVSGVDPDLAPPNCDVSGEGDIGSGGSAGTGGSDTQGGDGGSDAQGGTHSAGGSAGSTAQGGSAGAQSGTSGTDGGVHSGPTEPGTAGEAAESGGAGATDGGSSAGTSDGNCGCGVAGAPSATQPWYLLAGLVLFSRRRRPHSPARL